MTWAEIQFVKYSIQLQIEDHNNLVLLRAYILPPIKRSHDYQEKCMRLVVSTFFAK